MKKRILSLFVVLIMLFTLTCPQVYAGTMDSEENITISTTIIDGMTVRGSKLAVEVIAMQDGKKIKSSLSLNGQDINPTWSDTQKETFTLVFGESGKYTVDISAGNKTDTYTINYIKAQKGDYIGEATITLEGLTIGMGYIIEPIKIPIYEGENAAIALDRVLTENGFSYDRTGKLENSFYLSHIGDGGFHPYGCKDVGKKVNAPYDITETAPERLISKIEEVGGMIDTHAEDPDENQCVPTLGEFDYTFMSGWMVTLNNSLTNVGFSDIYLSDGDVLRVQFTLYGYGQDIGYGWGSSWYTLADKTQMLAPIAEINSSSMKDEWLKDENLKKEYDQAIQEGIDLYAEQKNVDTVVEALEKELSRVKVDTLLRELDSLDNISIESNERLKELRKMYNSLGTDKTKVTNISKLTDAEKKLAGLVDNMIEAAVNAESKDKEIKKARKTYESLSEEVKKLVTKFDLIEEGEAALVDNLISKITTSENKEEAIKAARQAYETLPDDSKTKVKKLDELENAEAASVDKKIEEVKLAEDKVKATKNAREAYTMLPEQSKKKVKKLNVLEKEEASIVDSMITALGSIKDLDYSKKDNINNAKAAYQKLTDGAKKEITLKSELDEAVKKLSVLEDEIYNVNSAIRKISKVIDYGQKKNIEEARKAYDALPEPSKAGVGSYGYNNLLKAEKELSEIVKEIDSVKKEIEAIGTVDYSKKESIEKARKMYDSLPKTSKEGVDNLKMLEKAEEDLKSFISEIDKVKDKIIAIGKVDYTKKKLIAEAREAYNVLPDTSKSGVASVYDILLNAEKELEGIETDINTVKKEIEAIGTVDYSKKGTIETARKLYENLPSTSKAGITNLEKLEKAEESLKSVIAEIDKVKAKITEIGDVDYTKKSIILEAKGLYDALPEASKAGVDNLDILVKAAEALDEIEISIKAVEDKIAAIGNVDYSKKTEIETTRAAYDALSETSKSGINNYETLVQSEKKLKELEKSIDIVREKIEAIGNIDYSKKGAIEDARAAYDALPETSKAAIDVTVLTDAEKILSDLIADIEAVKEKIGAIGSIDYSKKGTIENARAAYDVLPEKSKAAVDITVLTNAEKILSQLTTDIEKVKEKIEAIGNVDYSKKGAIEDARAAYDALPEKSKAAVDITVLTNAEKILSRLTIDIEKVKEKIEAIGKVNYSKKNVIEAARNAYNALPEASKKGINNLNILERAEKELNSYMFAQVQQPNKESHTPKTGDSNLFIVYLMLLMITGSAIVSVKQKSKK